jgi:hypothetical protein
MTRTLLTLGCVLVALLLLAAMRLGWRNRARRQGDLPALPTAPPDLGRPTLTATGLYVGTTFAGRWQDRVVHAGLGVRAAATAALGDAGVLIDRRGADPVFVPRSDLVEVRLAPGLAGKVVGEGGLLVFRWRLGEHEFDTGFRADDKTAYPHWVRRLNSLNNPVPIDSVKETAQ